MASASTTRKAARIPVLHERLHKDVAGYLPPSGGFLCGRCDYFHAPDACELVEGLINPQGCCNLWRPRDRD